MNSRTIFLICLLNIICNEVCFCKSLIAANEIINVMKIFRFSYSYNQDQTEQIKTNYKQTIYEYPVDFIFECAKDSNKMSILKFLAKPDSISLKIIHTFVLLHTKKTELDEPLDTIGYVESLLSQRLDNREQLLTYYYLLFNSIEHNWDDFDYSKLNWSLDSLGLVTGSEKAIFYFSFIDNFTDNIILYCQTSNLRQAVKIQSFVGNLPMINQKPYFEYENFDFIDYEILIYGKNRKLNDYYIPILKNILFCQYNMMVTLNYSENDLKYFISNSLLGNEKFKLYGTELPFNIIMPKK